VFTEDQGIVDKMEFAADLKKYQFDLAVVFPNSFRSAFMTRLTGAEVRLGYATEVRRFLLTDPIAPTKKSKTEYRVDYFFKILSPLGIKLIETKYQPFVAREAYDAAKDHLREMGIDKNDFLVTIHPATSKPERSWHMERYSMLCQRLVKEFQAKIVLLGGEKDAALLDEIKKCDSSGAIHALSKLSLQQAAVIIERSKLFIGNDSGIMHLAAMMGTPIVGIFGPGNPATTGPFIDPLKRVTVSKNYPCSPCRQKFFKECKPSAHHKPYCLEDISVKEVAEAVEKLIHNIDRK
jgi:lipopolysaccharide heptosyltransferase II